MSLSTVSQLGQEIARSANETQDLKENVIPVEVSAQALLFLSDTIKVKQNPIVVLFRDVTTDSIYDFDYWDACNWEGSFDNLQITRKVIYPDGFLQEEFKSLYFIDTVTSLATISTITNTATVSTTNFLQSNVIYNDNSNINNCKITVDADLPLNLNIRAQNTNSTNWEACSNNIIHTFSTTGTELKYKIYSTTGSVVINKITVYR